MSSDVSVGGSLLLEQVLKKYAEDFSQRNPAAKVLARGLSLVGVGMRPLLDHFVFCTLRPKERVQEFLDLGYEKDPAAKLFSNKGHHTEVFRKGCAPAILIKCPRDKAGQDRVKELGDQAPFVLALRVDDIEEAAFRLEKQAVPFLRPPAGKREETLRQMATVPEMRQGMAASYIMLVERHAGDRRFYLPGFWEQ